MASGKQKAQENIINFRLWKDSVSDEELFQIVWREQLNRGEISKACGFAKSVLNQNPTIKSELEAFEIALRERKVLPELSDKDTPETKLFDQGASKHAAATRRASTLETEVVTLRAENEALKRQIRRYKELSEVLSDIGIMPL